MNIKKELESRANALAKEHFQLEADAGLLAQTTRKDFEGDYTIVVFPLVSKVKKAPPAVAQELGELLEREVEGIAGFNVVKGFLNLSLTDTFWFHQLSNLHGGGEVLCEKVDKPDRIMVEYSSPNTNKPLHLGHIRNNLLGYSVSEILAYKGHKVFKANLINDRGIHICKSMLAWQKFGEGESPESSGLKGDHLVGKYYVRFDKEYRKEIEELMASGLEKKEAERQAPLFLEAQEMLRKWEAGDSEVMTLWEKMNSWVYEGFDKTYKRLGVDFDQFYYESKTYVLGKDLIEEGLEKGVFYKKDDGSVWADLSKDGLDEKLVLRSDGTSVYMTQDIGTADLKYRDYQIDRSIYVVGDEQEYHFRVLKLIMEKLDKPYAPGIYHLSYGMIDLPEGRMKSREGTVVDADELMDEMVNVAREQTDELGKVGELSQEERNELYRKIGLGALKFHLLKIDPKKRITFNPEKSIDFQGNTGPFIQYNHTRIKSLERKLGRPFEELTLSQIPSEIKPIERELLRAICAMDDVLDEAAEQYNPALVANYCYELAKLFSSFFAECPVVKEEDVPKREFRSVLSALCANCIEVGMGLLGVEMPGKM